MLCGWVPGLDKAMLIDMTLVKLDRPDPEFEKI
jgi:hypothetical protein